MMLPMRLTLWQHHTDLHTNNQACLELIYTQSMLGLMQDRFLRRKLLSFQCRLVHQLTGEAVMKRT